MTYACTGRESGDALMAWRLSLIKDGHLYGPVWSLGSLRLDTPVHPSTCHLSSSLAERCRIPVPHEAPSPQCFCGIYACERPEDLRSYAIEVRRRGPVALYPVLLREPIRTRSWPDPPNTWRGKSAEMTGPVAVWGPSSSWYAFGPVRHIGDSPEDLDRFLTSRAAQPNERGQWVADQPSPSPVRGVS